MNDEEVKKFVLSEIEKLYTRFVTDPAKVFDPNSLVYQIHKSSSVHASGWGLLEGNDPDCRATYSKNEVEIIYYRRFKYYLGDADTFINRFVKVDGRVLLNEENQ